MRSAALLSALGLVLEFASTHVAAQTRPGKPEVLLKVPEGAPYYIAGAGSGVAQRRFSTGDVYQGEWKNGMPDGVGKMTYMLGGAYEGEWKNGQRHGKGVMTLAGSGKRVDARFAEDRRVDVIEERPSPAAASATYALFSNEEPVGSHIRNKVVFGPLPLDRGYDALTPDQKRLVRSYYPTLAASDEPPYPAKGGKDFYTLLETLVWRQEVKDHILVYVAVDEKGEPTSVTTISDMNDKLKEVIASAAGLMKYKPAQCGGQPCAGMVPFDLKLSYNPQ